MNELFTSNMLLDNLRCPECGCGLRTREAESALICVQCNRAYPFAEGIPVMLVNEILCENKETNILRYSKEACAYDESMHRHLQNMDVEEKRIRAILGNVKTDISSILEIGVGTGFSREILSRIFPGSSYYSTDISLEMLKEYRKKWEAALVVCDAEHLPFPAQMFDMVVCSSFLHHLPADENLCREVSRVLKPEGIFLGLREPRMFGCDLWFKIHHIAKRYGDRKGLKLLLDRAIGKEGGLKGIFSYDMMKYEDFLALDLQEIRGAILHQTPTKNRGGVNAKIFKKNALKYFSRCDIVPFGLGTSSLEFIAILYQKRLPYRYVSLAEKIDSRLRRLSSLPFESFSFRCMKQ